MYSHASPAPSSLGAAAGEDGVIRGPRAQALALFVVAAVTAVNWPLAAWADPTNLAMLYLLGQVFVSAYCSRAASIVCAIGGVLAFDFFFVPPVFTFHFGHTQHLITGFALLTVGLVVSTLASRARAQTRAAIAAHEARLRNSLLASLSHDLRTPLAVIAGSASNLRENDGRLSDEERRQLLSTIYEQSRDVSLAVSDILEMTRLHAGPVQLDRQWWPIEELVGAAIRRCHRLSPAHQIRTQLPLDLPLLYADGVLVEKLLMNLIENAIKHTPTGTSISIGARREADELLIVVEDDGPGVPEHARARLFDEFFRVQGEGAVAGSGLGLSICRTIAELHGGRIRLEAGACGGARFVVTFPYEAPPQVAAS